MHLLHGVLVAAGLSPSRTAPQTTSWRMETIVKQQLKFGTGIAELKRLVESAEADPTHCDTSRCVRWPWSRDTNGYGRVWLDGRTQYVHRLAWEQVHGAPPKGMELDHQCGMRACVNPGHLRLVTHAENIAARRPNGFARSQFSSDAAYERYLEANRVGTARYTAKRKASMTAEELEAERNACAAYSRTFYALNADAINAQRRANYAERKAARSPEELACLRAERNTYQRQYRAAHRDEINAKRRARKAAKAAQTPPWEAVA